MAIVSELAGSAADSQALLVAQQQVGYIVVVHDPVSEATNALSYDYEIPAGAIVGTASVTISAEPAGRTAIANVARVRPSDGSVGATTTHVVDFGGLRTVSSLTAPENIGIVRPWTGTTFSTTQNLGPSHVPVSKSITFTEVATERLLVTLMDAATSDSLAEGGRVTIHDPPADLELRVGGERVHIAPGPVRSEGAKLQETIDITDAVQRAVDAGQVPVPLELRSSVPAALSITPGPSAHVLAHRVTFPEGERRTVSASEEGIVDLRLPLAAGSASWRVRRVRFDLQGDVGERRVLPPDGPPVAAGAELLIDPDRPLVVRLPPSTVRSFRTVDSLRLLLRAEKTTELSGHLTAEAVEPTGRTGPGEPIADTDLVASTVEPAPTAAWVTLPLQQPAPLDPDAGTWAVIQVARGRAVLALAEPAADPDDDAVVLRRSVSGHHRPLPTITGVPTTALPLRVGGEPPPTAPFAALAIAVPGTGLEPRQVTPESAPAPVELIFDPAITSTVASALSGDELVLRLTIVGPGDHTIGPVVVGYEEAS